MELSSSNAGGLLGNVRASVRGPVLQLMLPTKGALASWDNLNSG
jgi:hypothetical protein